MKTRAAVAWEAAKPLSIETIELEGPKSGEVLVEIMATGICHTDAYTLSGADPEGLFPAIRATQGKGVMPDGTSRFRCEGAETASYPLLREFREGRADVLPSLPPSHFALKPRSAL